MARSVHDVLLHHLSHRVAYERLCTAGGSPQLARDAIALFAAAEQVGLDVVGKFWILSGEQTARLAAEADAILRFLRLSDGDLPEDLDDIPLVSWMYGGAVDLAFFRRHRDVLVRGMANFAAGVGELVFDDGLIETQRLYRASPSGALPPELARPYVAGERRK